MQKQGYRTPTTHYCIQAIKSVARRPNLLDPEPVKTYVATANVTEARKAKLVEDLDRFYRWKHVPFQKRNYRRIENLPFILLESEYKSDPLRKIARLCKLTTSKQDDRGAWNDGSTN